MSKRAHLTRLLLPTLLFAAGLHTVAFGQRDRSDRPGPSESRAVRGKEIADADKKKETPQQFIDRELRQYSATLQVPKLRAVGPSFHTRALGGATAEDKIVAAVENARRDYENVFKSNFASNQAYGDSHALLRLEDFARAYVMALDPAVGAKFGNGFTLAEKRSQVTTYHSYEEILRQEAGLNPQAAKELAEDAKRAVHALLSRNPK
jgi:hypothetical protein